VAENVIGNGPDAVLFQMSAPAKRETHEHLQREERKKKEKVKDLGMYNTKNIKNPNSIETAAVCIYIWL